MKKTKITKTIQNGHIISTEIEYPQIQETEVNNNDDLMDKLMASAQKTNQFSHNVRQALIHESKNDFDKACEDYIIQTKKERKEDGLDEESEKEQRIELIKLIATELVEFTYDKDFKESKALSYLNTLEEIIAPRILAFVFNASGKKDAAFSILEKHPSDITDDQYDTFYEVLRIDIYLRNKSYNHQEEKDIYNQRKSDFLFLQERLALHKELTEMPTQDNKSRKPKL
jgi:hypothetical protein